MTELVIGDPVAAERNLREGYDASRAMGERGYLSGLAALLAEALYAQGRLDEALQMTEVAQTAAVPDDVDRGAGSRATRAKVLARRGEFSAARRLMATAEALQPPVDILGSPRTRTGP